MYCSYVPNGENLEQRKCTSVGKEIEMPDGGVTLIARATQ